MEFAPTTTLDPPGGIRGMLRRVVSPFRSMSRTLRGRPALGYARPRTTLEAFLAAEFNGDEDAYALMSLSRAKQAEITDRFPGTSLTLLDMVTGSYSCDPVMAVRAYRIMDLTVEGNRATAEVEYEVEGEFKRMHNSICAYKFVVPPLRTLQVSLTLQYDAGGRGQGWRRDKAWCVEDPPIPKVSIKALLRHCLKKRDSFQAIARKTQQNGHPAPSTIAAVLATYEEKVQVLERLIND